MIPQTNITQLQGALGILPPSAGDILAIVGSADPSATLPVNTPAAFARLQDLQAALVGGPLLQAAAKVVQDTGKPVVVCRSAATTAGATANFVHTGVLGTSVPSIHATPTPIDDLDVVLRVVTGGTLGVAGITLQYSIDGGRTMSFTTALGTALLFVIPGSGTQIDFAAGTLLAGDTLSFTTTAPEPNSSDLLAALTALQNTTLVWNIVLVTVPLDATLFPVVDSALAGMAAAKKYRAAIGNTRIPTVGETESTYLTALTGIFGSLSSNYVCLCAGAAKITSAVDARQYRRPISHVVASRAIAVTAEVDLAEIDLGSLTGVVIRDANGNVDEHDEAVNPGLDDARFTTLRTVEGYQGIYITNPRIFAATGSDFIFLQFRRVMNVFCATMNTFFTGRLSRSVRVDKTTGFILEQDALEIEAAARAALRSVLLVKPSVSDVSFVLSRTDNVLSTFTLTGDGRAVPLAYPKVFNITLGFNNPALRVVKV